MQIIVISLILLKICLCRISLINSPTPQNNTIKIKALEQPQPASTYFQCSNKTNITFVFDEQLIQFMKKGHPTKYMLRIDYEPNKCLSSQQDVIILQGEKEKTVQFRKTCCNLFTKDTHQIVRIVAAVRQMYLIGGFPVSKRFGDFSAPIITLIVISSIIYVVFIKKQQQKDEEKDD